MSQIFIYDNMSTDSSDEIFSKYEKVKVFKWNSNNQFNDGYNMKIKSNAYRNYSRDVDWVIVCDCDEFLYHESLIDKLSEYKSKGITVPLIDGHDMMSYNFPVYDGKLITEKIKIGSKTYKPMCKQIIFDPKLDIDFGVGAHFFKCNKEIKCSDNAELKLLHYKFLGIDYVTYRYNMLAGRLSEFNKVNKFGVHYFNIPFEYMEKTLEEGYNVI